MNEAEPLPLKALTTKIGSGATPRGGKRAYHDSGTPLIRSLNVYTEGFREDGLVYLDETQAEALKGVELMEGDVLLNITGASIGRVSIVPPHLVGGRVNQHVAILRPKPNLSPRYCKHYLASPRIQRIIHGPQSGVTRPALTKSQIETFRVPVVDIAHQEQISDYLDAQFSRLADAEASLRRAKQNLERYRRSVLHAACTGRLVPTEAALAKAGGRDYEAASGLLERILKERRKKWEKAEIEKAKVKGKELKDDAWKKRYKEPVAPDMERLPKLPEGWCWASLEAVTSAARPICYGILKPGPNQLEGVRYVEVKDLRGDRVNLDTVHQTTRELADQFSRSYLNTGDVLIAVRGTYGRIAIVPDELNGANVSRDVVRAAPIDLLDALFLRYALLGPDVQGYWQRQARGVAVKGLNVGTLKQTAIALPPTAEQRRICAALDDILSLQEAHGAVAARARNQLTTLRQSALQSAFGSPNHD